VNDDLESAAKAAVNAWRAWLDADGYSNPELDARVEAMDDLEAAISPASGSYGIAGTD
jgi:hypothetical protein